MVNLLKFKDHAEYEDRRATDLTGRDAYRIYGGEVSKLIGDDGRPVVGHSRPQHLGDSVVAVPIDLRGPPDSNE